MLNKGTNLIRSKSACVSCLTGTYVQGAHLPPPATTTKHIRLQQPPQLILPPKIITLVVAADPLSCNHYTALHS